MDIDIMQIWCDLTGMKVGNDEDEDALKIAPQWMHAPGQITRTTPAKSEVTTHAGKTSNATTCPATAVPTTPSKPEPHQEVNMLWANKVMCIGEAYNDNRNSVYVPYAFTNNCMTTTEHALLNSGATDNFIDQRTAQQFCLTPQELLHPRILHNIDGTTNHSGKVKYYINLLLKQGGRSIVQHFYWTNLGRDQLIPGFPWLTEVNLDINWRKKKVKGISLMINTTTKESPEDKHLLRYTRMCAQQATIAKEFEQGDEIIMRV